MLLESIDRDDAIIHDLVAIVEDPPRPWCPSDCRGCELARRRRARITRYQREYEFPTATARYVKLDPARRRLAELGVSSYEDPGRLI